MHWFHTHKWCTACVAWWIAWICLLGGIYTPKVGLWHSVPFTPTDADSKYPVQPVQVSVAQWQACVLPVRSEEWQRVPTVCWNWVHVDTWEWHRGGVSLRPFYYAYLLFLPYGVFRASASLGFFLRL